MDDVPRDLDTICLKCLEIDPDRRASCGTFVARSGLPIIRVVSATRVLLSTVLTDSEQSAFPISASGINTGRVVVFRYD